jgi:hypothetical protein
MQAEEKLAGCRTKLRMRSLSISRRPYSDERKEGDL